MRVAERLAPLLEDCHEIADRIYEERMAFLQREFTGYVADTYYVEVSGYFCWPAQTDGIFEGYTDLLPGEAAVLDEAEARGFETVGYGASRVVCRLPVEGEAPEHDLVVKFARCGMGDAYVDGQRNNLVEYRVANGEADLPVVPCYYCSTNGEFALFPEVPPSGLSVDPPEAVRGEIRSAIGADHPGLNLAELSEPENLCRWEGTYHSLDYSEPGDARQPRGVPRHVDADSILAEVDRRRRTGEKRDLRHGGGYADGAD